jgi:hypothetical protein
MTEPNDPHDWAAELSLEELARQVEKAGDHLNDLYGAACYRASALILESDMHRARAERLAARIRWYQGNCIILSSLGGNTPRPVLEPGDLGDE